MTGTAAPRDPFAPVARSYEEWFSTPLGGFVDRMELAALDALLPPPGGGRVAEIGAGTGHVSRYLAGRGYRMLGIEPSRAMLGAGREYPNGIEWCLGVGERLPIRDASLDGVLVFATLEFVHDPTAVIHEALRATRPGGWLAVGLLHAHSAWAALYRSLADAGEEPWRSARFFTPEQVAEIARMEPAQTARAAHLGPNAQPPFEEAEEAGKRAGHPPALEVMLWRKPG